VREHRNDVRPSSSVAGAAGIAVAIGWRIFASAARRPVDSLAILGAGALSIVIVVNAVFLQAGPHPAPFFANPTQPPAAAETRPNTAGAAASNAASKSAPLVSTAHLPVGTGTPQTVSARHNDQIAELIGGLVGSPSRVKAVQRALSEFGYGQVKPSGVIDEPTSAAIEKFERDHLMPVSGRLSDRLVTELASMTGRPLD
jgi:hypothetical protein